MLYIPLISAIWRQIIMSERIEVESKEQWMHREEQRLKQLMTEQYYRYLSLLRVTNNFEKRLETYQKLNFKEYQGQISVIGRISEIQMGSDSEKEFCFPIIQTPVNKVLFERQENQFAKRGFSAITRKLVVTASAYRQKLIVPLNKMVATGKKNKEQLYIFTHLNLLFRQGKEVCFGLTDNSYIIQLDQTFYNGVFRNLELALSTSYSDLNLAEIFPESQAKKGNTFVVMDIRTKIHQSLNNFVVLGILKKVNESSMKKAVNAKQKEVLLEVVQDVYQPRYRSAGVCRIYVRFDILDEQELLSHLKEGCVYLFLVTQVMLSDNVLLNLKLNSWRRNFIRITNSPILTANSWQLYHGMQLSAMSYFTNPCIFRNLYKFKVVKYELKLFYAKVVCENCETSIYRSTSYEYKCPNEDKIVKGDLRLWAIVGVMDGSCYGELNIENKLVMDYFNVPEEETERFKQEVAKYEQDEGKSGIVLYFRKTKEEFNQDDPNECVTTDKNPYLGALIQRCLVLVIDKTIIGSGRINTNENFAVLDEETRHEAMTSFARSREFFKKAKIFVNGNLRTFEGRGRYIPYIKVECVF